MQIENVPGRFGVAQILFSDKTRFGVKFKFYVFLTTPTCYVFLTTPTFYVFLTTPTFYVFLTTPTFYVLLTTPTFLNG